MGALTKWDAAKKALAEAHRVDEVLKIRDKAETIRYALIQAKEAPEVVRQATQIKLRAERRAGQLLKDQPKNRGGGEKGVGRRGMRSQGKTALSPSTYTNQGIDKRDASKWQKIAEIPEAKFEDFLVTMPDLSTAAVVRLAKQASREKTLKGIKESNLQESVTGKFPVLYADPPWQYSNSGFDQSAASQYPTMPTNKICDLPIENLSTTNSVLFLWVTSPLLPDGLAVMGSWGFEYKTSMVWIKNSAAGIGFYWPIRHEFLLVGTRGSMLPENKAVKDSVFEISKTKHSEKPNEFYALIESLYSGPYLELFARKERKGWKSWGNQI